jgi:hypothetical protein
MFEQHLVILILGAICLVDLIIRRRTRLKHAEELYSVKETYGKALMEMSDRRNAQVNLVYNKNPENAAKKIYTQLIVHSGPTVGTYLFTDRELQPPADRAARNPEDIEEV